MLPVQNFTAYVEQHQLFNRQNNVLVAVSGGMDSVLLVYLLKAAGYTFGIAHCNFQLRDAEANADQDFCSLLAAELQVPFHTINFDTLIYAEKQKISIQMAARELRYQWFEQIRQRHHYHAVALAHHQNDTIETILLNLTRGTRIAGLHGILPQNGHWVRPLLFLNRQQITEIALQNQLQYREDSSNASTKYARNKIRHEVIPKLKELNPNLENTFERNLSHFRELEQLLQLQVQMVKRTLVKEQSHEVHISKAGILQLQPQRLLLGELLKAYGFNDTVLDDVISALPKHAGRVFESAGFNLLLDRESLIITPKNDLALTPVYIEKEDQEKQYADDILRIAHAPAPPPYLAAPSHNIAAVDENLLIYPLIIRSWQEGDYFMPLGMQSRKKLSDFFINQKVPRTKKLRIPILVNGNGDVIWVAGYRLDNRYKLTSQTKKVIIFELLNHDRQHTGIY